MACYLKIQGRWCYLYRAIDRDGNLIDTMLSATRDMKAAQRFFRSARSVVGLVPDRVTTDGHNSYPRAIRSALGRNVRHRTSVYLNNRLEQDHRGIKGRIRCMRGFKEHGAANRFAESTTSCATSSGADRGTTNTFQQPADAVTFSITPASHWASCKSHSQKIRPRNALQTARDVTEPPGGSSSGSGAGLAAGLFPLALGSDSGGSVRHPASACGIVGLKPTYGLISRRGVSPLSATLDHVGPMARSASDIALLLDVIAGHDPRDPGSVAAGAQGFGAHLGLGVRGLRIGFVRHFHETDMPASAEVIAAIEQVAAVLASEGAQFGTVVLPPLTEFAAVGRLIIAAETWPIHAERLRSRPQDYGRLARERLLAGESVSAGAYLQALGRRRQMIAAVDEVFRDVDILLTVSALETPCRIEDAEEVARTHPLQAWMPFNVTGHPAIAIMAGLSRTGLPLSAQLVGRTFQDAEVLRVAAAYERATAWHTRHPAGL